MLGIHMLGIHMLGIHVLGINMLGINMLGINMLGINMHRLIPHAHSSYPEWQPFSSHVPACTACVHAACHCSKQHPTVC